MRAHPELAYEVHVEVPLLHATVGTQNRRLASDRSDIARAVQKRDEISTRGDL